MKTSRKTRRMNYSLILLTIMLTFIAFSFLSLAAPNDENTEYYSYLVKSGDTLWDISSEFKKDNEDPRKYIDKIVEHNQLVSLNIVPGQVISLPVDK